MVVYEYLPNLAQEAYSEQALKNIYKILKEHGDYSLFIVLGVKIPPRLEAKFHLSTIVTPKYEQIDDEGTHWGLYFYTFKD